MIQKEIEKCINEYLEGQEYFLVEVQVKTGNVINVSIDGDEGVSIEECVKVSRYIESKFDRDQEDYELRVSSPGIDRPFKMKRQYIKYLEREIQVVTLDEIKREGVLKSVSEEGIGMQVKQGKKVKEQIHENILFTKIKEAKPVISFKTKD
jgi:ribosome maturation factor RimP